MKFVILVGDGMGDYPLAELDNRTPLQAAHTPAMDFLAARGDIGLLRTVPQGYPPGSDVANLSLLGYRPEDCYTGRAPLEAASMGVNLAEDEIAFRCNLVTLDRSAANEIRMIDYSAGHITTAEAGELILALDRNLGNTQMRFYPGVSYRHLFVLKGGLAGLVTVPPHDHTGRDVTEYWRRYQVFPEMAVLLEKAEKILAGHEVNLERERLHKNQANALWLWGEGRSPVMTTIKKQFGVSGALISAVDLLKGIGVYAGMEIINVPGATGYLDTNYEGKASAALDALNRHDLVFVHVEAPDEVSHQGLLREKIQAIEDFDRRIVQPVLDGLADRGDFRLVVAMDHFTPISLKTHVAEPVPYVLYDSRRSQVPAPKRLCESDALSSGRILDNGAEFMTRILRG